MVADEASGGQTVRKPKTLWVWLIVLFITVLVVTFGVNALIVGLNGAKPQEETAEVVEPEPEVGPEPELPAAVNFQPVVDAWAASVKGNRSVLIYDLDREEVVASYNADEVYNTASLYKLFVVYEGYKRVQNGTWDGNAVITEGKTVLDCLDLAIRESYSPCAEKLWAMINHDALDNIIEAEWGIVNSDISRLLSNVKDITSMMHRFYQHPDITDEVLLARMWDSFLNQPETTYDWRQGLPSGFSANVDVYSKVGWAWNGKRWDIYHDTAIVHFKNPDRTFIVTVMTNYIDFKDIRKLATGLEVAVNATLAESTTEDQ